VKLNSDLVNKPIPAGLLPIELKSPPTPVCAPIALNLALLLDCVCEKRKASAEYCAYMFPVLVELCKFVQVV
jgi:hypothetical protein